MILFSVLFLSQYLLFLLRSLDYILFLLLSLLFFKDI